MLILFVFSIGITSTEHEQPTNSSTVSDDLEPDQKNRDKKMWQNLLKVYFGFRQTAEATLEICGRVTDWAWSSHKFLSSIRNMSQRAAHVWQQVQKTGTYKLYDIVGLSEHIEENIFQNTDWMIHEGAKQFVSRRKNLVESTKGVFTKPLKSIEELEVLFQKDRSYEFTYMHTVEQSACQSAIDSGIARPDVRRHLLAMHTSADGMAGGNATAAQLSVSAAIAENSLQAQSSSLEGVTMQYQADAEITNARNRLYTDLGEHELLNDAINVSSLMLLNKAAVLDRRMIARGYQYRSVNMYRDALKNESKE